MFDLPTLFLLITAALIAVVNPVVVGLFVLTISVMLGTGHSAGRLLSRGIVYLTTIFVMYLLVGFGLLYACAILPTILVEYIRLAVAILAILAGLAEVKAYFWPDATGFGLHISERLTKKIHNHANNKPTYGGMITLGLLVASAQSLSIGVPYMIVISLLPTDLGAGTLGLLGLYNLIFILPLFILLISIANGTKISAAQKWKESHKYTVHLLIGLCFITLGWLLILMTNGAIQLG